MSGATARKGRREAAEAVATTQPRAELQLAQLVPARLSCSVTSSRCCMPSAGAPSVAGPAVSQRLRSGTTDDGRRSPGTKHQTACCCWTRTRALGHSFGRLKKNNRCPLPRPIPAIRIPPSPSRSPDLTSRGRGAEGVLISSHPPFDPRWSQTQSSPASPSPVSSDEALRSPILGRSSYSSHYDNPTPAQWPRSERAPTLPSSTQSTGCQRTGRPTALRSLRAGPLPPLRPSLLAVRPSRSLPCWQCC
jgi:hypothetical protein